MENLNQTQKSVLAYLKANKETAFSPTQVGVAVGKKLPKSASTWSKPILEKLVEEGLVVAATNGTKTTYQFDASAKPVISQKEIEDTKSAEEIAAKLAAHITTKNGASLKTMTGKKDRKTFIEKMVPAAIRAYDKENAEKVPVQYVDSLTKMVVALLIKPAAETAPKAPKAANVPAEKKEPKVREKTVYETVDMVGLIKDVKNAVKQLGKDAEKADVNRTVRETTMSALTDAYQFNETNLRDKRTKAILNKVRCSVLGIERVNDNTDTVFEAGTKVKFTPHVSSNLGFEKVKGEVITTFINDFGARFVVIKVGDKRITKRDKDVTLA